MRVTHTSWIATKANPATRPSMQRAAGMALRHARHHRHQQAAEEADEQRMRRRATEQEFAGRARTSALCAAYSANAIGSHAYAQEQHPQQRRRRAARPVAPQPASRVNASSGRSASHSQA